MATTKFLLVVMAASSGVSCAMVRSALKPWQKLVKDTSANGPPQKRKRKEEVEGEEEKVEAEDEEEEEEVEAEDEEEETSWTPSSHVSRSFSLLLFLLLLSPKERPRICLSATRCTG